MQHAKGLLLLAFAATVALAAPPATQRNFVACPIVRDTQTVPCWLAEYEGELYYLGIQTDTSAAWQPPLLGHRVLVEGTVTDAFRICGGIVLSPVRTSALPELDTACNTAVLPSEERYTVPFAPRGPGPSAGGLAFQERVPPPADRVAGVARQFVVPYDFDWPWVTGKTARVLQQAFRHAREVNSKRIEIVGFRGATLLSNGTAMVEKAGIAERRANHVAAWLREVGLDPAALHVEWRDVAAEASGNADYETRRVTVEVKVE